MSHCQVVEIVSGQESVRILFLSAMLDNVEEISSLWESLRGFLGHVDWLALGQRPFQSERLRGHFLALFILALHLVLQTEGEELIHHLLQDFTVLHTPEPGVETISELRPEEFAFLISLPAIEQMLDFVWLKIGYFADNALVLHEAVHHSNQVFLAHAGFDFWVVLLPCFQHLVLLPFHEFVFSVLAEVILVLLFHCWSGDASVGFGLEE